MTVESEAGLRPGPDGEGHLAEVWGDVVDLRHLAGAVSIGAGVSLGFYVVAGRLFAATVDSAEVGRSYAMLVGLLACVAGGAIAARLFPPKRVMTEFGGRLGTPPIGDVEGASSTVLPPQTVDEMRALGLHDASDRSIP